MLSKISFGGISCMRWADLIPLGAVSILIYAAIWKRKQPTLLPNYRVLPGFLENFRGGF
jgi:hypothetical protein